MKLSWLMTFVALSIGSAAQAAPQSSAFRQVMKEVVVPAPAEAVWSVWTTDQGLHSFFTEDGKFATNVELKPDGAYEFFFYPNAPMGQRGTEGGRILGFEPGRMLTFTWRNRPDMPQVRPHRTYVVVYFEPLGPRETRVTLVQGGWGSGPVWDQAYAYFDEAWAGVLGRLQKSFANTTRAAGN
jgi:uncharacterized protein YndB with AHSA1/START domain